MKKVVAKISEDIISSEYVVRRLIKDLQEFCIPGTINLTRIKMRNISFKIESEDMHRVKGFSALECIQFTDC